MTSAPRPLRPALAALILAVFGVAAPAAGVDAATGAASTAERPDLCAGAVAAQERRHGIPDRLLTAISLVESGRWDGDSGKATAWPWTVTAEGKGRFFPTKAAAIAAVRSLQARGVSSIDVGCLQVNLYYHPDAFGSLNTAFDPAQNAAYAAKFLTDLKRDQGSWQKAVQHYHSSTAEKRIPYQKKVYAAWRVARSGERAAESKAEARADTSRIRRISRQIERDHRYKLSAYRRNQIHTTSRKTDVADAADAEDRAPQFLATWPPRTAYEQFRAENLARAWAFNGSSKNVRP
jgi:hypothetical protein